MQTHPRVKGVVLLLTHLSAHLLCSCSKRAKEASWQQQRAFSWLCRTRFSWQQFLWTDESAVVGPLPGWTTREASAAHAARDV